MAQSKIFVNEKLIDDFDEYSETLQKWNLEFTQLDSGKFNGRLSQISTGPIFINHSKFNRKFKLQGISPNAYRTFGIPVRTHDAGYFKGKVAHENSIVIYPEDGELDAISPADFYSIEISISDKLLKETADMLEIENIDLFLNSNSILSCNPTQLNQFKNYLIKISNMALSTTAPAKLDSIKKDIEENIPKLLFQNLLSLQESQEYFQSDRRREAVKRVEQIVNEDPKLQFSIPKLCKSANVSQRTLEYSFHELFNLTPQQYIKNVKLNHIRKILKHSNPKLAKVVEIANENGFWHMGKFAKDYKKLFGELPSETLNSLVQNFTIE